jgi:hypothetical protein
LSRNLARYAAYETATAPIRSANLLDADSPGGLVGDGLLRLTESKRPEMAIDQGRLQAL